MAKTLVVLSIDPEFRDLCPPLDADEKELLRASIIEEEGCHNPIIYWAVPGNPILDGHHRHEICQGEGLPFPSKALALPDREAAIRWIWRHQLGKRNLTDANKHILRGRYYNSLKGPCGGNHKNQSDKNVTLINHAEEIATTEGVSARTVIRDGKLAEAIDAIKEKSPEVAAAVVSGEIAAKAAAVLANASKPELAKVAKAPTKSARQKAVEAIDSVKTSTAAQVKDQNGNAVPDNLRDVFTRGREEFAKALLLAKQLMAQMHLIAKDAVIGVEFAAKAIDKQAETDLGNVRRALRFAVPHAICPYCKAKDARCKACHGKGWVGERIDKNGQEAMR